MVSSAPQGRVTGLQQTLVGVLVVSVAAAVLAPVLFRGWYPHDEGAIGQAAERILQGQVPHRDFDEIYTGLLSYWHAAAFKVGGLASTTLRLPLFTLALAWVIAVYRIALRFAPAMGAGLLAILCLVWAVPNYPAPMPSWYNLFLATFGALALIRWRESSATRWLVLAGALGGLSFLVKLTGLVFLIGGGLVVVFATATERESNTSNEGASRGGALLVGAGIAGILAVLFIPFARAGAKEVVRLWLPIAMVGTSLVVREWRLGIALVPRLRSLVAALVPFLGGALAPVLLWTLAMLGLGAFDAMIQGVFVMPFRRVASAAVHPPAFSALLSTAIVALLLVPRRNARASWIIATAIALLGAWILVESYNTFSWYRALWHAAWGLPVLAAAWGAGTLVQRTTIQAERSRRDVAIILTMIAVTAMMVEFPFAAPIYTIYALPISMLAVGALLGMRFDGEPHRAAPGFVVMGLLLAFGIMRLLPASVSTLGYRFAGTQETYVLDVPRSGLRMTKEDASRYADLVGTLQELGPGRTLWAGPDAPEVYFLSGLPNRTRVMFDFLDADFNSAESLVDRVARSEASLVVIKTSPSFSPAATSAELDSLRLRFSGERTVPGFRVFWR